MNDSEIKRNRIILKKLLRIQKQLPTRKKRRYWWKTITKSYTIPKISPSTGRHTFNKYLKTKKPRGYNQTILKSDKI